MESYLPFRDNEPTNYNQLAWVVVVVDIFIMDKDTNKIPAAATASASTASASSSSSSADDATLAQALQAVETLVHVFGFDYDAANQAVNAVGVDVTTCYNYILDQRLGNDQGGAVYPIDDCPHLEQHVCLVSPERLPKAPFETPCMYHHHHDLSSKSTKRPTGGLKGDYEYTEEAKVSSCPMGENWLCLECGNIYCSRYINGHGLEHWKETTKTNNNNNNGRTGDGHCVAVSLADLSVWCHICNAYVRNEKLTPLLQELERIKFQKT